MKRKLALIQLFLFSFCISTVAQTIQVQRIDPNNWYVGMKNPKVQLLVYGNKIAEANLTLNYPGVTLEKINKVENPNYLFLDLNIAPNTQAGTLYLNFSKTFPVTKKGKVIGGKEVTQSFPYQLKPASAIKRPHTVSSADLIYLLMPDRFANGDEDNDSFADMADTVCNRKNPFARHGGDLQGVTKHLNYFEDLGVTALWLNPVIENDQPQTNEGGNMRSAYHGYGFTDHYKVDRRLGGNDAYLQLCDEAHKKGIKIIQDAVYNHVGKNTWLLRDMPEKLWLNQWDTYTNTSYKDQPYFDPYASDIDKKVMQDGWFVPFLPDLNQRNPFVANYLIQHALWTVAYFGIDAWRIDTYMYNDQAFMNRCNQALLDEFPNILIFGESAVNTPVSQAHFVKSKLQMALASNQPSTCDFVLEKAIKEALNQDFGWDTGVSKLYQTLAQDAVYHDPYSLVTFVDNHDMSRYLSVIGENYDKYKMGLVWLLTLRGIPSIYYGTENLTKNFTNPSDAEVRKDFVGGFKGDERNMFEASGRNDKENEAYNFVKKLAQYRKNTPALHSGKMMQYTPADGVYVYFRYNSDKTVMIISNQNKTGKSIDTQRFNQRMVGFGTAQNVLTGEVLNDIKNIKIKQMEAMVLELGK